MRPCLNTLYSIIKIITRCKPGLKYYANTYHRPSWKNSWSRWCKVYSCFVSEYIGNSVSSVGTRSLVDRLPSSAEVDSLIKWHGSDSETRTSVSLFLGNMCACVLRIECRTCSATGNRTSYVLDVNLCTSLFGCVQKFCGQRRVGKKPAGQGRGRCTHWPLSTTHSATPHKMSCVHT